VAKFAKSGGTVTLDTNVYVADGLGGVTNGAYANAFLGYGPTVPESGTYTGVTLLVKTGKGKPFLVSAYFEIAGGGYSGVYATPESADQIPAPGANLINLDYIGDFADSLGALPGAHQPSDRWFSLFTAEVE
jgi:hypothetical protein